MLLSHGGSSRGISGYSLHTDGSCPELSNCRIVFFTRRIAEVTDVYLEFSFLSRDLSFGPTDQREVICELVFSHGESRRVSGFMSRIIELTNLFSHGESRRFSLSRDMFFVTNLRISFFHTECRGCRGGYEGGTIEA